MWGRGKGVGQGLYTCCITGATVFVHIDRMDKGHVVSRRWRIVRVLLQKLAGWGVKWAQLLH